MACMDDRRKDESGIVVGCLVLGLLFAIVATGVFAIRLLTRPRMQMVFEQAVVEETLPAQMSAIDAEESTAQQQEKAEPEAK